MIDAPTKARSLRVCFQDRELGTISSVPGSADLVCAGDGAPGLRQRIDWYRLQYKVDGQALLELLHDRLQGYTWAEWAEDEPDLDGFELLEHHLSKGHWITLASKDKEGDRHGSTHVYLDEGGTITRGPAHMLGLKPQELPSHTVAAVHGEKHPESRAEEERTRQEEKEKPTAVEAPVAAKEPAGGGAQPAGMLEQPASKAEVVLRTVESGAPAHSAFQGQTLRDLLGDKVTIQDLASLAGAPDDARVVVNGSDKFVALTVQHPHFTAECTLLRDKKTGDVILDNEWIHVAEEARGKGLGTKFFAQQVAHAQRLGVKRIECDAVRTEATKGEEATNGYYTWALMGCDAPLEQVDRKSRAEAMRQFPGAKTVADILAAPGGRQWWKEHGDTISDASFDLSPGSHSIGALQAYLQERERRTSSAKSAEQQQGREGRKRRAAVLDLAPWEVQALEAAWDRALAESGEKSFDPQKHPRGHEGNPGQFASAGMGGALEPSAEKPSSTEVPQLPPAEHIPDDLPIGERVKRYQQQRGAAMASAVAALQSHREEAHKRWKEYGRQTTEMQGRYYGVNFGSTYLYDNDTGKKLGKRASDKIRAQYEELDAKRKQAQDDYFDGTRTKAHALLQKMLGNQESIPLEVVPPPDSSADLRAEAKAGMEFVSSLVGVGFTGGLQESGRAARLSLIPTDEPQRANCGQTRINVTPFSSAKAIVHELGHWMDNHLAGTLPASLAFLKYRVGNEKPQPLKEVLGGDYDDSECGRKDDFEKAFGSSAWYVGKDYGVMATEIFSKGLEKFYEDAPGFAATDPEYFSFICGICDGSLRHQEGSS